MIIDLLENRTKYPQLPTRVMRVLNEIAAMDPKSIEPGIICIGDVENAKVVMYETKTGRRFASHLHHADLTIVLEGEERMTVADAKLLVQTEHLKEKDVIHYEGEGTDYALKSGMFAWIVPGDAHRTKQILNVKCQVKSLIINFETENL